MIVQLQHIQNPQHCREKMLLPLASASTQRMASDGHYREQHCKSKEVKLHKYREGCHDCIANREGR